MSKTTTRRGNKPSNDIAAPPSTAEQGSGSAPPLDLGKEWYLVAGVLLCGLLITFSAFIRSGGDRMSGDNVDNRFYVAILEHWVSVLQGHAAIRDPGFFYPLPGALGFSDAVLLYVPFFTAFKMSGADGYLSLELTLVLLRVVGFLGFYLLARVALEFPVGLSLMGSVLFTFANMYLTTIGHAQMSAVCLMPAIALLAIVAWRDRTGAPVKAALLAFAASALFGLLMLSSYYIGYLFGLVLVVLALTAWATQVRNSQGRPPLRVWGEIRAAWRVLAAAAIPAVMFAALFLWIYLPVLNKLGGREFQEVRAHVLFPTEIANPSVTNALWGDVVRSFPRLFELARPTELGLGWPPITLLVFGLAVLWAFRERRNAVLAVGLTTIGMALLATGYRSFVPWSIVFEFVPGGNGLRVPTRINLVLNFFLVLVVIFYLKHLFHDAKAEHSRWRMLELTGLCAVLLLEQLNWGLFPGYSRRGEALAISKVAAPPAYCKSFYVSKADRPMTQLKHLDAMLVSLKTGIPTVNGYSGVVPPGYTCPDDQQLCSASLQQWAESQGVTSGLCALDLTTGAWAAASPGISSDNRR